MSLTAIMTSIGIAVDMIGIVATFVSDIKSEHKKKNIRIILIVLLVVLLVFLGMILLKDKNGGGDSPKNSITFIQYASEILNQVAYKIYNTF